jgi:BCCT family betaine/carnitine transporter
MAVFGGTAVEQYFADDYQGVAQTVKDWTPELSLFRMLEVLPMAGITSFIGIVLVIVFFVTSSDSGSLVIDTITAGHIPRGRDAAGFVRSGRRTA